MIPKEAFLLCLHIVLVVTLRHEKPAHKTLWPERCTRNQWLLNDCNWCWCDKSKFNCHARHCSEVDMFGHFNDAIRDLNVGMEGHGSWRSSQTACDAGVLYQRGDMICVCNEDGSWPNPICRDVFQVLHPVESIINKHVSDLQECIPTKLYVIRCNVCYCPASGQLDPSMCTKRNCTKDDPLILGKKKIAREDDLLPENNVEVYAECHIDDKYKIGCRNCVCLRNNRLICDNCNKNIALGKPSPKARNPDNYCSDVEPNQPFYIECNTCVCDKKGMLYCTAKICRNDTTDFELDTKKDDKLKTVDRPYYDQGCVPGTKYKKGCNTCYCTRRDDGKTIVSCFIKPCCNSGDELDYLRTDCAESTVYETNCMICRCDVFNEIKRETCYINEKCSGIQATYQGRSIQLDTLHGYCEPLHTYEKDCNTCRCMPDGKIVMCTSNICSKKSISVDVVPINQRGGSKCSRHRMYQVDCNFCFCLSNGNVLCTTMDCKKEMVDY